MCLTANMKFVLTYFTVLVTGYLFSVMMMKRTPWCQCDCEYAKQEYGENPVNM